MSQAKVDKYKKEKKNRAKTVKRAKVKRVARVLIGAALLGVIIGIPLGRFTYNKYYEKKMENATISSAIYDYWFQEYFDLHYGDKLNFSDAGSDELSDEQLEELVDDISSNTDAIVVTPEDIDEEALEDAINDASATDAQ